MKPPCTTSCIALLGGSFDPVHKGHVALGAYFADLFAPQLLRIIPAGNPWQKDGLQAPAEHRLAMVRLAFGDAIGRYATPVGIDRQEIERHTATYTIDTLRALRAELGPEASLLFLMGADQLQHLDSWQEWQLLFDYAHVCAGSRPGFAMDATQVPESVTREFARRIGAPDQIRGTAHGLTYMASDLAVDISATKIRAALRQGELAESLVPGAVLEYIQQHHLYKN